MEIPVRGYPLSWEVQSEREPPYGMSRVSPEFVERRVAAPQARHAAEMLLYFLDFAQRGTPHSEVHLQYTH